jgi:dipeptidyl aminopeptidase/acylaminoacyl peptidase
LRDVDEPKFSADGNLVVYILKTADMEKDKVAGNLWLAKWDGSENRALTFGNKGQSHPRWSPDGKWIGFLSGREDENEIDQLWILPSNGGEAEAHSFARLFLVPGMNHCSGGPALDDFDTLGTMQSWVEQGKAPDSMLSSGKAFPGRTRPLCAYPETAEYKGKGNPEDATSFSCEAP